MIHNLPRGEDALDDLPIRIWFALCPALIADSVNVLSRAPLPGDIDILIFRYHRERQHIETDQTGCGKSVRWDLCCAGATATNELVNLGDFYRTHIAPDLLAVEVNEVRPAGRQPPTRLISALPLQSAWAARRPRTWSGRRSGTHLATARQLRPAVCLYVHTGAVLCPDLLYSALGHSLKHPRPGVAQTRKQQASGTHQEV